MYAASGFPMTSPNALFSMTMTMTRANPLGVRDVVGVEPADEVPRGDEPAHAAAISATAGAATRRGRRLEPGRLGVFAEDVLERADDLSLRAVNPRAVDQQRHEVLVGLRRGLQLLQRRQRTRSIPLGPELTDSVDLSFLGLRRDDQDVDGLVLGVHEPVDSHLHQPTLLVQLLLAIGRVGDLGLEIPALDPREHAFEHRTLSHLLDLA